MSPISAIVTPFTAETGRIAAMKAAWKSMPGWKRWMIGSSVVFAGLAGIGLLLTSFVFTGGATATILGGVVAGLSVGAGATGAIANGHTAKQFFQQGKYLRGFFALIGCAAGILGSLGAIFHLANAVNTTAQIGIGVGAASGTTVATGGAVITGCMEQTQTNQSIDQHNDSTPLPNSDLSEPLLSEQEDSTSSIVHGLNRVPARQLDESATELDKTSEDPHNIGVQTQTDMTVTDEYSGQEHRFGM